MESRVPRTTILTRVPGPPCDLLLDSRDRIQFRRTRATPQSRPVHARTGPLCPLGRYVRAEHALQPFLTRGSSGRGQIRGSR